MTDQNNNNRRIIRPRHHRPGENLDSTTDGFSPKKDWDRHKKSSYHTYNYKMPGKYDSILAFKIWPADKWDKMVTENLPGPINRIAILDIGTASGRLLEKLVSAGAVNLAACDLAPRMVEFARHRLEKMNLSVGLKPADAEYRLPWPDNQFDAAVLSGVLHHFRHPRKALTEIRRVLKNRGRLIVIEPFFPPPIRHIFNLGLRIMPHEGDCRYYSLKEVESLLTEGGFDIIKKGRFTRLSLYAIGDLPDHDNDRSDPKESA